MLDVSSAILIGAVFIGGALQRIAGMGFAMVVAPLAVLTLAGSQGVVLTNLLGAAAGLLLTMPVRRLIEWRRLSVLCATSVVGAATGAVVVGALDAALFKVVVGVLLVIAIVLAILAARVSFRARAASASVVAGVATGMLVTMSGIGGPPMTVYAVVTRWDHHRFAATMQPYIAVISAIGAAAVLVAAPGSFPQFSSGMWVTAGLALVVGLIIGELAGRVVSAGAGRAVVIVLGLAGAVSAISSGLATLFAR